MDLAELDMEVKKGLTPEEDRELGILLTRRDFYGEKGLEGRIKELEDKNVRDTKEQGCEETGIQSVQGNK